MVHRKWVRPEAMRIAIIAALPGELKPLVRGWDRVSSPTRGISIWLKSSNDDEYIAVSGGMGTTAALRSFAAAEHIGTLDMVLSVGWAGALTDEMLPGHCYIVSEVIDSLTGERFFLTDGNRKLRLVTTTQVANEAEKNRLRGSYGAALVDMESSAISRLAQIRGIPICCFKAVSDGRGAKLPDINPFIDEHGQLRIPSFLGYVALRPQYWGSLIQLGRTSSLAAQALAITINKFLEQKDADRTNRTGAVEQ
jgi:adenosylhomocysteine nucleosidase